MLSFQDDRDYIMATGIPKRLNLDTFEINIYWPKNMFECDPRVKIDFLRLTIFIYTLKPAIYINSY